MFYTIPFWFWAFGSTWGYPNSLPASINTLAIEELHDFGVTVKGPPTPWYFTEIVIEL